MVAAALDELGARGRMVGVVTHVRELAERLPVRFEVRKVGGSSTVERVEGEREVRGRDLGARLRGADRRRGARAARTPRWTCRGASPRRVGAGPRRRRRPAATVAFVDGVQRIDARVWVDGNGDGTGTGGGVRLVGGGRGAVRRPGHGGGGRGRAGRAVRGRRPAAARRSPPVTAATSRMRPPRWRASDAVSQALGRVRGDLEGRVAARAAGDRDLLVVDGPLGGRRIAGAVGYVKTHHVAYLDPVPAGRGRHPGRRGSGRRCSRWATTGSGTRGTCGCRAPPPPPWWGVVRCEAPGDLAPADAVAVADRVAATLPRFASQPHNDPRAPQNLHPIAGLERELKRRLGDAASWNGRCGQAAVIWRRTRRDLDVTPPR